MNTRQHERDGQLRGLAAADPGSSADLEAARRSAEAFARDAQDAIDLALSGDSEAFLRDNRQQGGE